jgi:hypothetical protein
MKRLLFFALISVLIISCKENGIESIIPIEQSENFVSIEDATGIASIIEYPIIDNLVLSESVKKNSKTSMSKAVESVTAIPDENGATSYYIVNYKDNGFVMISADNRTNPILAFSNSAKFPLDKDKYPNGLVEWIVEAKDHVKNIRASKMKQTYQAAQAWEPCAIQMQMQMIDPIDDPCGGGSGGCQDEYETVGPLLQTTWGLWGDYNDLTPYLGCNNIDGRGPTGCVATAMAQIIRFHEFPNNYNWADMPNHWGTMETAQLMSDIGNAVNMEYGCDGSSADTQEEAASSFKNDFGYSYASYAGYSHETVKQQLRNRRPVI